MNKFQKALASAFATGALLVNTVLPVLAETTIQISGNGEDTTNTIGVSFTQTTTVTQSNVADVFNKVEADAETGENNAEDNTGGDVSIETGDADVDVKVESTLNQNSAEIECCPGGDFDALISGNGTETTNTLGLTSKNEMGVFQTNYADVTNIVEVDAETGENDAEDNTGGSVSIKTGDAHTGVTLATTANANSAKVGGDGEGSSLSLRILNNGSDSDNTIGLSLLEGLALVQSNVADVFNKVEADAETGENDAKDNTGGEVSIETGDADVDVTVDNMVNFNWAESDCGCLLEDLLVKIAGNGEGSDNVIGADLDFGFGLWQGNCDEPEIGQEGVVQHEGEECELEALVDADAETGENDAKDNTGEVEGNSDPSIETGAAEVDVEIENSGNSNVYGETPSWEFPDWDFNFNFSFDLSDLLDWLSSHS